MNKDTSESLTDLMLKVSGWMDQSVGLVRDTCDDAEFESYRRNVGNVMGLILTEILNPIYKEHPDLKPIDLGGSKVIDKSLYEPIFYAPDQKNK